MKKLPWWAQLALAALGFIVTQVVSTIVQTGKLPDWVSDSFLWISLNFSSAASAFIVKTLPLWSVLVLGGLVALGVSVLVFLFDRKFRDARQQLDTLLLSNGELVQENAALKEMKDVLRQRCSDLEKTYKGAVESFADVKKERDDALKIIKRIKDTDENASVGLSQVKLLDASLAVSKMMTVHQIVEQRIRNVLEAVMLCTKNELSVTARGIEDLVDLTRQELDTCLEKLRRGGYIQEARMVGPSRYQLTPKAKMHYKRLESGLSSELSFIK
ncbi:uncharacterized coiled coil protein [Pseudomonas chlororaphis subsp. aurantiaca]|nr:uncharacterized coiled coil protein [Pseudomonas chlororaphis subsp. aurantiaca]